MKKLLIPVALFASAVACAQQISTAKLALAEKTLGAMQMEMQMAKTMDAVTAGTAGMTKDIFSKMSKGKVLGPEAMEMAERSQKRTMSLIKTEMSWEKLKPAFVKIYAETYSEAEMKAMIAFYESPEGRSILDKTPIVAAKSMQVTQGVMAELMPKIMAQAEADAKASAAGKKGDSEKK